MAQPEVYSFNMGSNIVGTFTETAVGSDKYRLTISGYGYMYDDANTDFTRVGAHNKDYTALLPLCEQQYVLKDYWQKNKNYISQIPKQCRIFRRKMFI